MEQKCDELRANLIEMNKIHDEDKAMLTKLQAKAGLEGDEAAVLKASLDRVKSKELDVEREHAKELAMLNEKIKVLKRQVRSGEERNTRKCWETHPHANRARRRLRLPRPRATLASSRPAATGIPPTGSARPPSRRQRSWRPRSAVSPRGPRKPRASRLRRRASSSP